MTDQLIEHRRRRAADALRIAVTEHLDAWQLLGDGEFLDTFVVCSRLTDNDGGISYTTTSDNDTMAIDHIAGLLYVTQRQTMLKWERSIDTED